MLASDRPAELNSPVGGDESQRHTVLLVAEDADVRRYVRECLRDRADLRVVEASAVAIAEQLAAVHRPRLLIVDGRDAAVLRTIEDVHAVLIADDVPLDATPSGRVVTLVRPFGGRDLEALVDALLS